MIICLYLEQSLYLCCAIRAIYNANKAKIELLTQQKRKKMEAVRIMCQLSEAQISKAVDFVSSTLPTNIADLSDVDELMFMQSVRVCVDFDADALGNIKILNAEILNRDWDVLDTDSFAFGQYLMPIIDDYNARSRESKIQNRQILTERRAATAP